MNIWASSAISLFWNFSIGFSEAGEVWRCLAEVAEGASEVVSPNHFISGLLTLNPPSSSFAPLSFSVPSVTSMRTLQSGILHVLVSTIILFGNSILHTFAMQVPPANDLPRPDTPCPLRTLDSRHKPSTVDLKSVRTEASSTPAGIAPLPGKPHRLHSERS